MKVGSFNLDASYWGKPEQMNLSRPVGFVTRTAPGSDLLGASAAALAASAMVFDRTAPQYAAQLTSLAINLYQCVAPQCSDDDTVLPDMLSGQR